VNPDPPNGFSDKHLHRRDRDGTREHALARSRTTAIATSATTWPTLGERALAHSRIPAIAPRHRPRLSRQGRAASSHTSVSPSADETRDEERRWGG
jgi:hypothetical protein